MDIERYIQSKPELQLELRGSRGEMRGCCPFHTSPRGNPVNFAINVTTGYWLCRSPACGLHGSFPLFYKLLEGIENWSIVRERLKRVSPLKNWEELLSFQNRVEYASDIRYQELPHSIFQQPITEAIFPIYLQRRGYDTSMLNLQFDLRLCTGGEYRNRILFPFYDLEGQLLTFTARLMDDSDTNARYRFPDGATTNQFLYGVHRVNTYKKLSLLWVVEGQFDVIRLATLGEFALGISKGVISNRQLLDIKRICELYGCSAVACLDRGAFSQTQKIWTELVSLGVKADLVDIGDIAKDPGELNSSLLVELKSQVKKIESEWN